MTGTIDSREKIIAAATAVFAEKGKHGARMEEIAAKAEINRAMLYYYYSTREFLYQEVLQVAVTTIFSRAYAEIEQIIADESSDLREKLHKIIGCYFDTFCKDKTTTKIMLDAIANEPQELENVLNRIKSSQTMKIPLKMLTFLEEGMAKKVFRSINPRQFLVSMVAMALFYFIGKPVIKVFFDLQPEEEEAFVRERREAIIDLISCGIFTNETERGP
jgi:TetR/AcrR family transcriptional regulator